MALQNSCCYITADHVDSHASKTEKTTEENLHQIFQSANTKYLANTKILSLVKKRINPSMTGFQVGCPQNT
jgi:hypothetical protein